MRTTAQLRHLLALSLLFFAWRATAENQNPPKVYLVDRQPAASIPVSEQTDDAVPASAGATLVPAEMAQVLARLQELTHPKSTFNGSFDFSRAGAASLDAAANFALSPRWTLLVDVTATQPGGAFPFYDGKLGVGIWGSDFFSAKVLATGRATQDNVFGAGGTIDLNWSLNPFWQSQHHTTVETAFGLTRFWQAAPSAYFASNQGVIQDSLLIGFSQDITDNWNLGVSYTKYLYSSDSGTIQQVPQFLQQVTSTSLAGLLISMPNDVLAFHAHWQIVPKLGTDLSLSSYSSAISPNRILGLGAKLSYLISPDFSLGVHGGGAPNAPDPIDSYAAGVDFSFTW